MVTFLTNDYDGVSFVNDVQLYVHEFVHCCVFSGPGVTAISSMRGTHQNGSSPLHNAIQPQSQQRFNHITTAAAPQAKRNHTNTQPSPHSHIAPAAPAHNHNQQQQLQYPIQPQQHQPHSLPMATAQTMPTHAFNPYFNRHSMDIDATFGQRRQYNHAPPRHRTTTPSPSPSQSVSGKVLK